MGPASTPSASSKGPAGATCASARTWSPSWWPRPWPRWPRRPKDLSDDGTTLLWFLGPAAMALMALWGLYASRTQPKIMDAVGKIIAATSLATVVLIAGAAFIEPNSQPAPAAGPRLAVRHAAS